MFYSLRTRLLLTLMSVVIMAVGTVGLFTSRTTTYQFQEYVGQRDMLLTQVVTDTMLTYYNEGPGLKDLQSTTKQLTQIIDRRIIVIEAQGKVLADSDEQLIGQMLDQSSPVNGLVVVLGGRGANHLVTSGQPVGAPVPGLANGPPMQPVVVQRPLNPRFDQIEASFISSVNYSLILAVSIAGLMALLLTFVLSRRILGPIETLTATAREMEKGNLSLRVAVHSKDEIGQLTRAFNAMADGLAQVEALRRNMVSDVAHELRTPLTNIRGYLEAIRDGVARPTSPLIASLHEEAMLLTRLVDDLQELALAEAGQLRLVKQRVTLGEVVEKATSAVQLELVERRLTLDVSVPADLPMVEVDPERIGQVIRNLLSNAMRHTPPGGTIRIAAALAEDELLVEVRDTGVGIAPEQLPYIFERFFRADHSRARATGGAGLGLSIVKQLVKAHHGRIWAESALGEGTVFRFTLPLPPQ